MERKFLEQLGLEKEVIDKVLDEHSKDIGKHKKHVDDLTAERDNLKTQMDDVAAKLKTFDGVDVDALKGEIDTLKNDITAKEADFQSQLASRDFDALLDSTITEAKGKNAKLIKAALDMDALKGSKNQKEDAAAAIKALQETDAYLFDDASDNTTPAKVKTGGEHKEPDSTGTDPFVAAAMKGAGLESGKEG